MRLSYTRPALDDLEEVMRGIADHSPRSARRVQARIDAVINSVMHFPQMGKRTSRPTIRRVTTPPFPYLIFYEATGTDIIIHAIRHAARDPVGMPDAK